MWAVLFKKNNNNNQIKIFPNNFKYLPSFKTKSHVEIILPFLFDSLLHCHFENWKALHKLKE